MAASATWVDTPQGGGCGVPCSTGSNLRDTGIVASNGAYQSNDKCGWTLTCSDPTKYTQLTFTSFDTESTYDFVNIYSGGSATGQPIRSYNGQSLPDRFEATGLAFTVYLDADASVEGAGFTSTFVCVDPCSLARAYGCFTEVECTGAGAVWTDGVCAAPCGTYNLGACLTETACVAAGAAWMGGGCGNPCVTGAFITDSGLVSTRDLLSTDYNTTVNCRWTLTCTDKNAFAKLTFSEFSIDSDWDKVSVRSGPVSAGRATTAPTALPAAPIVAVDPLLSVSLKSEHGSTRLGFEASFECSAPCSIAHSSYCFSKANCLGAGALWSGSVGPEWTFEGGDLCTNVDVGSPDSSPDDSQMTMDTSSAGNGEWYYTESGQTLEECKSYCEDNFLDWGCRFITWGHESGDSWCYLHQQCTSRVDSPDYNVYTVYTSADGYDYRGSVATTTSGKVCMSWSVETKSDGGTGYWTGTAGAAEKGVGDHSYCRNPDGEPAPWCYTTDPSTRYEICDIGQSQSSDYVNIFDGGAATGDPARALRGTTLPDVVVGMGQALTVQLTSDSGTEGAGFEASFTCARAACLTGIPTSCATSDVGKYRSTGLYSAKQHSGAPIDKKWTILL